MQYDAEWSDDDEESSDVDSSDGDDEESFDLDSSSGNEESRRILMADTTDSEIDEWLQEMDAEEDRSPSPIN